MRLAFLYTIIFPSIALFTSCSSDFFNIKSDKNQTVPSTLEDFELLLDDYSTISTNTPGLGEIASDGHHLSENTWMGLPTGIVYNNQKNAYTWSNTNVYEEVSDWNDSYKKIFVCNQVLVGLDRLPANQRSLYSFNRIKGNALFIKAKTYFDLSQIYAEHPTNMESPFGLILKNGIDITATPKRSTVKETYQEIIAIIKESIGYLPEKPGVPTRASKNSCYAMLAKIYLVLGQYENALKYADSSLRINNKLMDYSTIDISGSTLGIFNTEVIFHSRMSNYGLVHRSFTFIDNQVVEMYDGNDLRKIAFFLKRPNGYVFKGGYNDNATQFTGIANDEVLLIRSEAYARTNKISEAMSDINYLLKNRYKKNEDGTSTYTDQTASGEFDALKIILTERFKELMFRGIRWSDIRRLNFNDHRFEFDIKRIIGGATYVLKKRGYQYTFPIPSDEISQSNVPQNPGWK